MTRLLRRAAEGIAPLATMTFAVAALLVATIGCPTQVTLPADASPSVRYYAALQDYNLAKTVAVAYAETPSTPADEIEKVLDVVEETDAKILEVAQAVAAGGGDLTNTYAIAGAALRVAANELRRIAGEGVVP